MSFFPFVIEDDKLLGQWRFTVFLHDTVKQMQAKSYIDDEAVASTNIYHGGIELHFARDTLHLSLMAHEATHACLFAFSQGPLSPIFNREKKISVFNHPEILAERIGNLTAILWFTFEEMMKSCDESDRV